MNTFHEVLSDISWGEASDVVRDFITAAFVRGGTCGVAQNCEYDGSTAIFTKRRYRDSWIVIGQGVLGRRGIPKASNAGHQLDAKGLLLTTPLDDPS